MVVSKMSHWDILARAGGVIAKPCLNYPWLNPRRWSTERGLRRQQVSHLFVFKTGSAAHVPNQSDINIRCEWPKEFG